jgi:putative ABC transport system ATP-binding protein
MITPRQQSLARQLLEEAGGDLSKALGMLKAGQLPSKTSNYKPKNAEILVTVDSISKTYKIGRASVAALKNVSLDIHKGEFVAITGTSGSGKSTLLQLIGGLDKPNEGTISIAGQNLAKLSDAKLSTFRNRTIGFIFQFFYLQPFLSLQTNIEVPAMFARTKRSLRANRSEKLAMGVGLSDRIKHLPRELSGGQMQRAAIARALQNNPSILLADEPTGNLDRTNALAIFKLFRQICDKQGTTIIVVTHDLSLAGAADRIVDMSDGSIV